MTQRDWLFRPLAWHAKRTFSLLVIITTGSMEKPAARSQQFARSTLYVLDAECLILYHDHCIIFVVLLLHICSGTAVHIIWTCTARGYITVVVLAAAYCRTAAASQLAVCSSYATAVRILHEHYLPLPPLAAAVELTIHTSVQGSPPERAKGSVLLHLDMNTYEYLCCWCGRTY